MKQNVVPLTGRDPLAREVAALRRDVAELKAMLGMSADDNSGLLYGAGPIAVFLGMTEAQVYHLHAREILPTFKIGARVCARRGELNAWLAAQSEGRA